ncbi:MAG TPA: type VII secretion-associated serine protease mycosin [Micromonosporaceae bacterium]
MVGAFRFVARTVGCIACAALATLPGTAMAAYATPVAVPGYAPIGCATTAAPAPAVSDPATTPWAVAASGVDSLPAVANGAGQTVAVIDSGVVTLPSFDDRVLHGRDFLGSTDGRTDCVGHGTAVASIIAASAVAGQGFRGLAPEAKILPVRVSNAELAGDEVSGDATTPAGLGNAITWAVDHGADILNISVVVGVDNGTLRAAVRRAVNRGVIVVASVGNSHSDSGTDPTPYPAAYPGVIGVGSIDSTGARSASSEVGPFLDVNAPGGGVTADRLPNGLGTFDGTSFAVPYVAATVALVRQEYPTLSASQVASRIFDTADPPPVGADAADYGHGIVDPYRAVAGALPAADLGAPSPTSATAGALANAGATATAGAADAGRQRPVVAIAALASLVILGFALMLAAASRRHQDRLGRRTPTTP